MSDVVIRAEGLGKSYRIGGAGTSYGTLRDAVTDVARRGVARLTGKPMARERELLWALKDVSFEVKRGEVLGIIGRNGAGKSTLLKILSRITTPTQGRVEIHGRVGSLLEVGTGFHPELTGRENIFLNGAILGMTRDEIRARFDEIVDFSGVEAFLDTPVKHYSSGMHVRLAFAVAAHLETEILLVDEVLAVGDAEFQKKCLGKMGDVAKGGRTVLFVSHNMAAVQRLCTNGIQIQSGTIAQRGPVIEVVDAYLAGLAGSVLSWERAEPSRADAYFERLRVVDGDGLPAKQVTTGGATRVELVYVVRKQRPWLQVSLGLLDSMGEQIFGSSPLDAAVPSPESPGRYRAVVTLPDDLLMPQRYGIRVALWHPVDGGFDFLEELRFVPVETASLSNSTPGGRLGQIALRCNWSVEPMEAAS